MRGCQKKVIFLKNTGCDLFDEAYFVVSRESEEKNVCEDSMIAAANKIIKNSIELDKEKRKKKIMIGALRIALPFLLGAFISLGIVFLI